MNYLKCIVCGRENATIIDGLIYFCEECYQYIGTCAFCEHSARCEFNDNPDPMPKVVAVRNRQQTPMGFVEQIQQMPNPERIKAMCVDKECVCYNAANSCCARHFNHCSNYIDKKFEFSENS